NYSIKVNNINPLLAIFLPELKVEPGTILSGEFHENSSDFKLALKSKSIQYDVFKFDQIAINQSFSKEAIQGDYRFNRFTWKDSIQLDSVHFVTNGSKQNLISEISWNPSNSNSSKIQWETEVIDLETYNFKVLPSHFGLNSHQWSN